MKMAAIKKVVADKKMCVLTRDKDGNRWIGDGTRFYVLDEFIPVTKENALAVLDVDKAKRDSFAVIEQREPDPRLSIYPDEQRDEQLIPGLAVKYGGDTVLVLVTEKMEIFAIKDEDLKPVETAGGYGYTLRRRYTPTGEEMRPAVMIQGDMMISAAIMPMEDKVSRAIADTMSRIVGGFVREYEEEEEELAEEE